MVSVAVRGEERWALLLVLVSRGCRGLQENEEDPEEDYENLWHEPRYIDPPEDRVAVGGSNIVPCAPR